MINHLLLLGALDKGEMHGYRLNDYVKDIMGMYTDIRKSTIYYTLEKLEKDGYIEQETEREGRRPERRVYRISDKGREYFLELLREHLGDYSRTYYDDDIGIAFIDKLPVDEVRRLLTGKREKIQAVLKTFRDSPRQGENWRYMVSHNIAHLEAELAWIYSILMDLKRRQ